MIFTLDSLVDYLDAARPRHKIVMTSGGFDILHVGHVRCIRASVQPNALLVVVVNDDEFLLRKKGYVVMPLEERLEVVDSIKGVDCVVPWSSPTQFVDEAIRLFRPDFFTKGGDRSSPAHCAECELRACEEVGCRVLFGVGGEKVQSSSWLWSRNANQKA